MQLATTKTPKGRFKAAVVGELAGVGKGERIFAIPGQSPNGFPTRAAAEKWAHEHFPTEAAVRALASRLGHGTPFTGKLEVEREVKPLRGLSREARDRHEDFRRQTDAEDATRKAATISLRSRLAAEVDEVIARLRMELDEAEQLAAHLRSLEVTRQGRQIKPIEQLVALIEADAPTEPTDG